MLELIHSAVGLYASFCHLLMDGVGTGIVGGFIVPMLGFCVVVVTTLLISCFGVVVAVLIACVCVVLAVGVGEFLDQLCEEAEISFQTLDTLAWRRRHVCTTPALWGEIGREFGAWDWEHVRKCMEADHVTELQIASQRQVRKNRKRKQAQLRNAKPKPMRGIHGRK